MTDLFSKVRFIMCEPSHPGNIGSAARAIKTMGFHELVLVKPKFEQANQHPDAIALASGAGDVLAQAQIVDTLEIALAPVTLSFALTARRRDLGPPTVDIRQCAQESFNHLQQNASNQIAVILGTERAGLQNSDIMLCNRICHIPANPEYSSLNVSQALQLAAWELRYTLLQAKKPPEDNNENLAPGEQVFEFLKHWQAALEHTDFLNPDHPKKLMERMNHLFLRAQLTQNETDMLRGVCTSILKLPRKTYGPSKRNTD